MGQNIECHIIEIMPPNLCNISLAKANQYILYQPIKARLTNIDNASYYRQHLLIQTIPANEMRCQQSIGTENNMKTAWINVNQNTQYQLIQATYCLGGMYLLILSGYALMMRKWPYTTSSRNVLGPRTLCFWSSGMYNPMHPLSWQCMYTISLELKLLPNILYIDCFHRRV